MQKFIGSIWLKSALTAALLLGIFSPMPATADWRKDVGTFRIGIVAHDDIEGTIAKVEPFRLAVAEALGLNVEIFAAKNYRTLINAHVAARIEYAIYSASAYATAWNICECIEPLVLPKTSNGADSYKSIVISAEDGPQSIADLATAKLAGLSRTSFAGYMFAAFELKAQGVELPPNIKFAKSGEEAIRQLVAGEYNALIGWSSLMGNPVEGYSHGTLKLIAALNEGKSAPFRMIWKSSTIPNRPHVIRKSLAGEAKSLLRDVLTRMYESDPVAYDSIEPVFGGGFTVARHGQFLPIIEYVKSLIPAEEPVEESGRDKEKPPAKQ